MFTGSGSNSVLDYQIDRFQLGVSGKPDQHPSLETSSTYSLSGALGDVYGGGSNLFIEKASQINENEMAIAAKSGMPNIPGMDMFK